MDQNRTVRHAQVKGQAIVVEHPDEPNAKALFVEISIDCPDCGPHVALNCAGHHLRSIRDLIIQWIDEHPELCGEEGGIKLAERMKFGAKGPTDPSVN